MSASPDSTQKTAQFSVFLPKINLVSLCLFELARNERDQKITSFSKTNSRKIMARLKKILPSFQKNRGEEAAQIYGWVILPRKSLDFRCLTQDRWMSSVKRRRKSRKKHGWKPNNSQWKNLSLNLSQKFPLSEKIQSIYADSANIRITRVRKNLLPF